MFQDTGIVFPSFHAAGEFLRSNGFEACSDGYAKAIGKRRFVISMHGNSQGVYLSVLRDDAHLEPSQ